MTANPRRGELAIVVEGAPYTLLFDYNTLCLLEETWDQEAPEILEDLQVKSISAKKLRTLFWAGLQEFHPHLTEKGAGLLIDALTYDVALRYVIEGFLLGFPTKEDASGDPRPQTTPTPRRRRGA